MTAWIPGALSSYHESQPSPEGNGVIDQVSPSTAERSLSADQMAR